MGSPGYHGAISGLVKNALDYIEDLREDPRVYLDSTPWGCISCVYGWQAAVGTLAQLRSIGHALRVSPSELRVAAEQLDGQAGSFAEKCQGAHARVGGSVLGSGQAAAALPQMLAAWEERGVQFGAHFTRHAEGHREAATGYGKTDEITAKGIDDAGSEL